MLKYFARYRQKWLEQVTTALAISTLERTFLCLVHHEHGWDACEHLPCNAPTALCREVVPRGTPCRPVATHRVTYGGFKSVLPAANPFFTDSVSFTLTARVLCFCFVLIAVARHAASSPF